MEQYLMSQKEIENLTKDISFLDEESLFEIEDQFETVDDPETLEEMI